MNNFPKLHNAMWPGLVGKGDGDGMEPPISLDQMLSLTADALSAALPAASTPVKISLLRLLRRIGGPKALGEIRAAIAGDNAEIRENAARVLTDWPSAEAVPDLMELAKTPPTPALKILALRAILRLIPLQKTTPNQKFAVVKAALPLIERPDEKRLMLAALREISTADALALVVQELENPTLKAEAVLTAIAIGEQLNITQPVVVSDAMKKVLGATDDKKLAARAQALVKN
jgi:hypothetical protein